MQDAIAYNPIGTPSNTVTISPDPAHRFTDFDSLVADPKLAVDGLRVGAEKTAGTVTTLLK